MKLKRALLPDHIITLKDDVRRRSDRLLDNITVKKSLSIFHACIASTFKMRRLLSYPPTLKIDISPLCNLHCTACIHARPHDNETFAETLRKQIFSSEQRMLLDHFRNIIDEVKGKICWIGLYYLGDPFMHPDVIEMCHTAFNSGINVHISSNFSFSFSDSKIENIVRSGLTHLTICVDGLSQEAYEKTRRGGKLIWFYTI